MARAALFLLIILCASGSAWAGPARFLSAIPAAPLMPGLAEVPGGTLVFDTPEGRVAEAVLEGRPDWAAVQAFYARALPPLGWAPGGPNRWSRGGEALSLERTGERRVRMRLAPGAPGA